MAETKDKEAVIVERRGRRDPLKLATPVFAARNATNELLDSTDTGPVGMLTAPFRAVRRMPLWVLAVVVLLIGGTWLPLASVADVPEGWVVGAQVGRAVDGGVDWMVTNWDPFFRAVNVTVLNYLMLPLERWLLALPWWTVTAVVTVTAAKIAGRVFGAVALVMMGALVVLGLYDLAMMTLAIVVTATILAVVLGVPLGILAAKSDRFDNTLRPVLDLMQTMPAFVYLIPILMLFGLGKVPAVLATVVYALPPIIRLTSLGIRQVDESVMEAGRAFGATPLQLLLKVQVPLALPTIMAGLNQTIMMALAMVVIASMIGAKGLGVEVLAGIGRLDVGRGLMGGIGIVIMAIILDRITQGFARSQQARTSRGA